MAAEFAALVELMPFAAGLGIMIEAATADEVVAGLVWNPRLCTAGGVMHGGALMTLADSAGALVAYLGLTDGETTATMTSTTQLFRPVTGGEVRATAVPLYRGRTSVTVQTAVRADSGHLVAQTTQVQAIRPARQ
jgi:1,4-dihydroxy-2-naphthoyl-CoA hydrolase